VSAVCSDLGDLIAGQWVLTTETASDGHRVIAAQRPVGWAGDGDAYERLTATTHEEMRWILIRRSRKERTST
jgi:hypothetical protein